MLKKTDPRLIRRFGSAARTLCAALSLVVLIGCGGKNPHSEKTAAEQAAPSHSDLTLPRYSGDAVWVMDKAASQILFTGQQGDSEFTGQFTQFETAIKFDPDAPGDGKIYARIDTGSAVTNDEERDSALPQKDWFDVRDYPAAIYSADKITRQDAANFIANGTLTIKGITKPLALPFEFKQREGRARADAEISLSRADFNVGVGPYEKDDWISYPVRIQIHIEASRLGEGIDQ